MANQNYTVNINFKTQNLDKVKSEIASALKLIDEKGVDIGFSDESINQMKKELATLEKLYNKSFNKKTGKLDTAAFSGSLAASGIDFQKLNSQAKLLGINGTDAFSNMSKSSYDFSEQVKKTDGLIAKMGFTLTNTARWRISNAALNAISGQFSSAYYFAKDLDKSLTNIQIVSGQTHQQMLDFAVEANKAARDLKTSTLEYADAALIYYQQGMNAQDVEKMTKATIMGANIAGSTTQEMSDLLTATVNGYKIAVKDVSKVTDIFSAVGASSAADFYELSTAIAKVSSIAKTAGVPIESLTAQVATIVSVTKQAPENVGNALKTIYTRMLAFRNQSKGMMVDDEGESFGVPSVEKALARYNQATGAQISLFETAADGTKQLRDMNKVIEDVGDSWQLTGDKSAKFGIATSLAGSRQQNNLIALFDTWGMYKDQLDVALNAEGTTLQQNSVYMESYAAHLKTMQAAKEKLFMTLLQSDDVKPLLDLFTGILDVTNNIVTAIGGLPAIIGMIIGLISKANLNAPLLKLFNKKNLDTSGKFKDKSQMTQSDMDMNIIRSSYNPEQIAKLEQERLDAEQKMSNSIKKSAKVFNLLKQMNTIESLGERISSSANSTGKLPTTEIGTLPAYQKQAIANSKKLRLAIDIPDPLATKKEIAAIEAAKKALDEYDIIAKKATTTIHQLEEANIELVHSMDTLVQKKGKSILNNSQVVTEASLKAEAKKQKIKQSDAFAPLDIKVGEMADAVDNANDVNLAMTALMMTSSALWSTFTTEGVPASEQLATALSSLGSVALMNSDTLMKSISSNYGVFSAASNEVAQGLGATVSGLTKFKDGISAVLLAVSKFALILGGVAAVVLLFATIYKVWDKLNVSLKEQQEIVDNLTSSIVSLKSEYEQLKTKGYLTPKEKERFKLLERELEIKERLLVIENKTLGNKILNDLNKGSSTQYNTFTGSYVSSGNKLDSYNKKIAERKQILEDIAILEEKTKGNKGTNEDILQLEEFNKKLANADSGLIDIYNELQPLLDSGVKFGPDVASFINSLNSALGLTTNYTSMIKDLAAEEVVLDNANKKLSKNQALTLEEKEALIELYPELETAAKRMGTGWTIEADAMSIVSDRVKTLKEDYETAQSAINAIMFSAVGTRLGFMEDELNAIDGMGSAMALLQDKLGIVSYGGAIAASKTDGFKFLSQQLTTLGTMAEKYKNENAPSTSPNDNGSTTTTTATVIAHQDMIAATIIRLNSLVEIDKFEGKLLAKQLKAAKISKNYTEELRIQQLIYENQLKTVNDIDNATASLQKEKAAFVNMKDFDAVRKNYNPASWFDAAGNTTDIYTKLLESKATDNASKSGKAYYDTIVRLYEGMNKYNLAIQTNIENSELMGDTARATFESMLQMQTDAIQEAQDLMTDIIEKNYEKQKKAEEDRHSLVIDNIDAEMKKKEDQYAAEDYQKNVAKANIAIVEKRNQIAAMSMDTSIEGQARKAALQKELDALLATQSDDAIAHARDVEKNAFEDSKDLEDKKYDNNIKILEDLSSENAIFNQVQVDLASKTTAAIIAKYQAMGISIGGVYASIIKQAQIATSIQQGADATANPVSDTYTKHSYVIVGKDWKAPSTTKTGDIVVTAGGLYERLADGTGKRLGSLSRKVSTYAELERLFAEQYEGKTFKQGGLLDQTGPFWGDGTKSKPEYVLKNLHFEQLLETVKLSSSIIPSVTSLLKTPSVPQNNQSTQISSVINITGVDGENVNSLVKRIKTELWTDLDRKMGIAGVR